MLGKKAFVGRKLLLFVYLASAAKEAQVVGALLNNLGELGPDMLLGSLGSFAMESNPSRSAPCL